MRSAEKQFSVTVPTVFFLLWNGEAFLLVGIDGCHSIQYFKMEKKNWPASQINLFSLADSMI